MVFLKSGGIADNEGFSDAIPFDAAKRVQQRAQSELKKLQDLTKDTIAPDKRKAILPLLHNLAWQKVKLDDARKTLMGQSIVIGYDNGGGQKGIRENPGFTAYNKLFTTFSRGIKQLTDLMPDDAAETDELTEWLDATRT